MIARGRRGRHSDDVKSITSLCRSSGFALGLVALSVTAGCAHFREGAAREAARDRAEAQRRTPVAPPTPKPSPTPEPAVVAAAPAVEVAPRATVAPAMPAPSPVSTPLPTAQAVAPVAAPQSPPARALANSPAKAAPPKVSPPLREAIPEAPVTRNLAPNPVPTALGEDAHRVGIALAEGPGTNRAIVIFANVPGAQCGRCETVKISVAPSGQVLIERTYLAGSWHYKHQFAHVEPARAAAFAARLSAYRGGGGQPMANASTCAAPATAGDGVSVEWLEAGRRDRFAFNFACTRDSDRQVADALRHAPDLLGLGWLAIPWAGAR